MAKTSPMQRSLSKLRGEGWTCWITEHWNAFSRKKTDLWGIGDIICLCEGKILLVQTTSYSNVAARCAKIAESPLIGEIRHAGIQVHVHGWRSGKDKKWICRVVDCS